MKTGMISIIKACLLSTLILLPCSAGHAEDLLMVTFVDEMDVPLRNVEVQLSNLQTQKKAYQKSNKAGLATFSSLGIEGTYELRAQLDGYISLTEEIKATGNQKLKKVMPSKHYFETLENQAAQDIKNQKYSSAIVNLQKLVNIRSQDAVLRQSLARAYAGALDLDKALDEADKAARLDSSFNSTKREVQLFAMRGLGQKALQEHDFAKAAYYFLTLTQLDPHLGEAYYGLSLAYGHQNKFQQALSAVDQALQIEPNNEVYRKLKKALEANAAAK